MTLTVGQFAPGTPPFGERHCDFAVIPNWIPEKKSNYLVKWFEGREVRSCVVSGDPKERKTTQSLLVK